MKPQYIDKSALEAEIKKNLRFIPEHVTAFDEGEEHAYHKILSFIDTLEVKEVDLEKEFDKCCENYIFDDECEVYTARHFFELGLKIQKGE